MTTKNPPKTPKRPSHTPSDDGDSGAAVVLERKTQRIKPPRKYQVLLINDDYTPMEFVVRVLQEFFAKSLEDATRIMLQVHIDGKGVCGVYSQDIAATKVNQVLESAHKAGHPLQCVCEPIDD